MKIELCEDNGFLNDGKPTLVVLVVNDKIRIPYEATKTIQELYQDVQKLNVDSLTDGDRRIGDIYSDVMVRGSKDLSPAQAVSNMRRSNSHEQDATAMLTIEREDIVECVEIKKDMDGKSNEDLWIGMHYRVINVLKSNGVTVGYEMLNDAKADGIRISALASEVKLINKFIKKPKPPKVMERSKKCPECGEGNAVSLIGDQYEGECEKCGASLNEKVAANV